MLVTSKIFLLLFLVLDLSFAALIQVWRDTSAPSVERDPDSLYLWTSVATFDKKVTDGQLVSIAEDGYRSMLASAWNNIQTRRLPTVMSAMVHQESEDRWIVYLASSVKGKKSLYYPVNKGNENPSSQDPNRRRCGRVFPSIPTSLKNALNQCRSNSQQTDQHTNDAKCGEMSILLEVAARTGRDPLRVANEPGTRIVAWRGGYSDSGEYLPGRSKIAPPCSTDGFGCDQTMKALTPNLDPIKNRIPREDYLSRNAPLRVEPQELFPLPRPERP